MMPTGLLLCGFPAFDGRCQAAYIPLATAKLTLSPLIPNPSPKFFACTRIFRRFQGCPTIILRKCLAINL